MDILNDDIKKLYFKFLIPTIFSTLVTSIYILGDAVIIGRFINDKAMAALNIITPIFSLFYGTGYLLGVGGAVMMSAAFGEKKIKKGQSYFTVSVLFGVVFSVIYALILLAFFRPIMYFIGASDEIYGYVSQYGYIFVSGAPLFIFSSMLQVFVRNDMSPKKAMFGVIAGGIANVVLDYIFIVPFDMGIAGGAWATLAGSVLSLAVYFTHFLTKNNRLKLFFGEINLNNISRVFKCGFPNFFIEISNAVVISLFNIQLRNTIGFVGITAYGIVENSYLVVNSLSNGISQTAQPLIASNYSAKNNERVSSVFRAGLITSVIISVAVTLFGELNPEFIINLFVNADDELMGIAVTAIRIYFISFLMAVSNIYISGCFQAVMKSGYSMRICILRGLVLSSVFVTVFPIFFGSNGIWYVMPCVELLTLIYAVCCVKLKIKL